MTTWVALVGRLAVGGVFGAASLTKITDPAGTVRAVRAYQLLPEWAVHPVAYALPYVELAVAVLLLLGLGLRYVAAAAAVMVALFMAAVASAAVRGLRIDCGCFGGGGATDDPQYAVELLRDGAFLVIAVVVAAIGRSRLSLDNALESSS
jgi:uncharacterized membrane protein YphA (DoxX/SURF4 family)